MEKIKIKIINKKVINLKSLKEKVYDWKDRLRDRHMFSIVVTLIAIIIILSMFIYKKQRDYRQASENQYNLAFFEVVNYVDNVESYLAKSLISNNTEIEAETLTYLWREANLAQIYLSQLPLNTEGLSNTAKFLNQVSDYSYSLSHKNIYDNPLTEDELNNLKTLHNYSIELKDTLNQLSNEINEGEISWGELTKKGKVAFAQEVSNISKDSFSNIEENFHEYSGLIYDGAFSEHLTSSEPKGLIGDEITEDEAKEKAAEFIGNDRIKQINSAGLSENGNIKNYTFFVELQDTKNTIAISITQKGGYVLYMNYNRDIENEIMSYEAANEKGKDFLQQKGFYNMKETYYLIQEGIITINYAYQQDEVVMYPDLIKVKIALDNGEVLGIETTGYLNSHIERKLPNVRISKEDARENINQNLEIEAEGLAVIPTEYKTEKYCYEFKGKVEEKDFLVYVDVETGKVEDVLVIVNTPNGILTK